MPGRTEPADPWNDHADLRERMVDRQIARRSVTHPNLLAALRRLPRHRFVPGRDPAEAHADHPLPIGDGQTISQPFIVAEMTAAALTAQPPLRRALDVGTGSGYQAALLALLFPEVAAVERIPRLAEAARGVFHDLGIRNIDLRTGDGSLGVPDRAPYCAIVVGAAAPALPAPLLAQLRPGGILVAPVGNRRIQDLLVIRRTAAGFERSSAGGCVFVPLLGAHGWPEEPHR